MVNVLSLFSGIGSFEKALENLGVEYNLVGFSEINPFAAKAYSILHNVSESKNLGDITKVNGSDIKENIDLILYGFPCQDISIAGFKKGFIDEDGNTTRSGLFFEALRLIRELQPKVAIAENVKNLTSKSMEPIFNAVLDGLDDAGYNNYWQVLNAADFGIPQARNRVFIVSIRKDIDTHHFQFPKAIPLTTCMRDYLDTDVSEKFYLSPDKTVSVIRHDSEHAGHICDPDGICFTLLSRDYKDPKVIKVN